MIFVPIFWVLINLGETLGTPYPDATLTYQGVLIITKSQGEIPTMGFPAHTLMALGRSQGVFIGWTLNEVYIETTSWGENEKPKMKVVVRPGEAGWEELQQMYGEIVLLEWEMVRPHLRTCIDQ